MNVRLTFTEKTESVVSFLDAFSALRAYHAFLFTDSNVFALYRQEIEALGFPLYVMEAGEAHKNEETLFALLRAMAQADLKRNSVLVVLGGGVPGDIGGLAASLYMRGISCIQVPTTLLSQVDSSVGGKTAIDFMGVKNLVGAFKQPDRVLVDGAFLSTLPRRELRCGLGEIIKHGALCPSIFEKLKNKRHALFDLAFLREIVPENIAFKASVVRRDAREAGLRKCLNLGHTTAHALELGGAALSHGECVLIGLALEAKIAQAYFAADGAFIEELIALSEEVLGTFPALDVPALAQKARFDKKNLSSGTVVLTVPTAAGKYELLELSDAEYVRALEKAGESLC